MNSAAGSSSLSNGGRKFEYEWCRKKLTQKEILLTHTIVCAGEKKQRCGQLGKGFASKRNLLNRVVL